MFQEEAIAAMKSHAIAEYPREACGFVVSGKYIPLANRHGNPEAEFEISEGDYLLHREGIEAIVHSHPNGPFYPSKKDMVGQISSDVPWAIIVTDGERASDPVVWGDDAHLQAELIGREFAHGITDCYSLCRSYFWIEHGILLPEVAREDAWWTQGENLYLENFAAAGFVEITADELRRGDAVLMNILSPISNHAGIAVGDGLLLHHLPRRLSRREPLGPWMRQVTHCLRHKDLIDA